MMQEAELRTLIAAGETLAVEFKSERRGVINTRAHSVRIANITSRQEVGVFQSLFRVSKRTASNDLAELVTHGLLTVEGAGPATRYRLGLAST